MNRTRREISLLSHRRHHQTPSRSFQSRYAERQRRTSTHHQVNPDRDHQFEPDGELGDDLGDEGGDGVPVIRLVELRLVQAVHQDDVVVLRDLPLCSGSRGEDEDEGTLMRH